MTTLDMLLGAEGSLHKSKTAHQLAYIMLVAGGIGWMVHAFSQLMHNKSHELTHLVTHLVWPHWQKLQPERPRA